MHYVFHHFTDINEKQNMSRASEKLTLVLERLSGVWGIVKASFKLGSSCRVSRRIEGGEKTILWSPISDLLWNH